jgi:prophage maintenance system killer protein
MNIIYNISKQDIIDTNQRVINLNLDELDVFGVNQSTLDEVFKIFDKVDVTDDLQGLIKKGVYLMASIAWAQPFSGGNKRTASLITATFFHHNEIEMVIPEDGKELRKLLYEIQEERLGLNEAVMEQIIFYISKTITTHEPR